MKDFTDKTSEQNGTDVNRDTLMAMQGFIGNSITFNADGSVTETNSDGHTLTTVYNGDGTITVTFTGEKTITKTITVHDNGNVTEVIS